MKFFEVFKSSLLMMSTLVKKFYNFFQPLFCRHCVSLKNLCQVFAAFQSLVKTHLCQLSCYASLMFGYVEHDLLHSFSFGWFGFTYPISWYLLWIIMEMMIIFKSSLKHTKLCKHTTWNVILKISKGMTIYANRRYQMEQTKIFINSI